MPSIQGELDETDDRFHVGLAGVGFRRRQRRSPLPQALSLARILAPMCRGTRVCAALLHAERRLPSLGGS
jgi:hypothetical protein